MSNTPQKPRWEYGGSFDRAWKGLTEIIRAKHPSVRSEMKEYAQVILGALSSAHVVTMEPMQFKALPRNYDDLLDWGPDPHLPFPILYVSVGAQYCAGVLYASNGTKLVATPFMDSTALQINNSPQGEVRMAVPVCYMDLVNHEYINYIPLFGEWNDEFGDLMQGLKAFGMDAVTILQFMQSANVDIEDQEVSRQVRRQAQRTGTPIAQRVYVRSPRHRHSGSGGTEHEHIEFSHRFEVRGHYKHYGPDTRVFRATERDRPHKILEHPTRGPVVRIWCPDFVKGSPELPLVLKTRVYRTQDDSSDVIQSQSNDAKAV